MVTSITILAHDDCPTRAGKIVTDRGGQEKADLYPAHGRMGWNSTARWFVQGDRDSKHWAIREVFMRKSSVQVTLSMLVIAATAFAQEVVGDWTGQLNTGFTVRVHLEKMATGYSGHLTNPSGNETEFDQVTFDGKHLHFAVNKLNLSYDSVWDEKAQAWNGKLSFEQVYPLMLKGAAAADLASVQHKRPQEAAIAAQPHPYRERDIRFDNPAGHNQLAGTLSVPNGKGPFPAVVLISGTGHNTRDEDVWGHEIFLVLADALNRKGVAVLRYDKRGVGGSTGDYDAATTVDFTSDAEAAVTWLKTQQEIVLACSGTRKVASLRLPWRLKIRALRLS
jgi:hypothetical protein